MEWIPKSAYKASHAYNRFFLIFAFKVDAFEGKGGLLKTNTFSQTYTTHYLVQPHDQSRFKNLLREKF